MSLCDPLDDSDRPKPCPFCGGDADFDQVVDERDPGCGGHYIDCLECGASTSLVFPLMDDVKALLLERWNRRATKGQS